MSSSDIQERLDTCSGLADELEKLRESIIMAAAWDAGFPRKITRIEVDLSVEHLRNMSEDVKYVEGKKPYGTIAAIFPYDAPAVMLARLGGAAILGGNHLRFSFSSLTPATADIITEATRKFPELESVFPMNNRLFGQQCIEDPGVRVLFISGGSEVGEHYREKIRYFDKIFFAGPGGMPVAVVFPDADPEKAAEFIATRAFINGGQYCTTIKKAIIHAKLYDTIKDLILEKTDQLKVGDPLDDDTDIGPILAQRTTAALKQALETCKEARILRGEINDVWVKPFVLEGDSVPDLELFGPFLFLQKFSATENMLNSVLNTQFGFLLAFFGTPTEETETLFRNHFGMVHDNPAFRFTPLRLPFGGKKKSGWILSKESGEITERDGSFVYSVELVQ